MAKPWKQMKETLSPKQKKIDLNDNDKIDSADLSMLRNKKETKESFDFNRAALAKQRLQNVRHLGRKVRGARIANLMRAAGIREEELDETDLDQLDEVLNKDATASDWIHDFVHSTNPKFEGKSKKERIKMALGAYYGKQNEEVVSEEQIDEKSDQARRNKTWKNVMAASRGARANKDVGLTPDLTGHKNNQQMNKAIGRAVARGEFHEDKDTVVKDKTGKIVSFKHEGEWKKTNPNKNPEGKVHNLAGQALQKMQQLSKEEVELDEAQYAGLEKEDKPGKVKTAVVKLHPRGVESETVEGWKDTKQAAKESYDEEGDLITSKVSFTDFMTMLEGRAQYMVKLHNPDKGHTVYKTYAVEKGEDEHDVKRRAAREHGSSYEIHSVRKKESDTYEADDENETNTTQKRGRGRPAGSKSGARGPRIK